MHEAIEDAVIDLLWQQIEPDVYITRAQFLRGLADWDITPIRINGVLAFVTLTRGSEIHYTSADTGAPLSLAMLRGWLAPILDTYGYATTRTPISEPRQHRLNKRLGFTESGRDEFCIHYKLEKTCLL